MTAAVRIAVRRHVVDAEVRGAEADGLAVQRRLSGMLDRVVPRALQEALDGLVADEEHLVVDRLEIDVDEVSLADLDARLTEAVRRGTAAFFRQHLPGPTPPGGAETRSGNSAGTGPIRRRTPAATIAEAFAVFLGTGRLPWSFRLPAGSDLEQLVREAWSQASRADTPGESRWEVVRRAITEPGARLRAVKQFSPSFVDDLVAHLAPSVSTSLAEVHAAIGAAPPAASAFARGTRLAALAAAAGHQPAAPGQLVRAALTADPRLRADPQLRAHVARTWPQSSPGVRQDPRSQAPSLPATQGEVVPHTRHGVGAAAAVTDDPSWRVDHAGLVLLHPFLPRYLETLGLVAGERLREPERAVALVHLLATGETVVPEHETTIAKLLCGWPLEDPVEREPGLSPTEIAEAEAVLAAAVGHWTALRSTTPGALRTEFISRPGVLTREEDDWVLRVEERSVDILLDQLPWGISLVRTPWMARLVRVEWRS